MRKKSILAMEEDLTCMIFGCKCYDGDCSADEDPLRRICSKAHMIDTAKGRAKSKSFHRSGSGKTNKKKKEMTMTMTTKSLRRSFHDGGGGGNDSRAPPSLRRSRSQSCRGSANNNDDKSKALFRRECKQSLFILRDVRLFMESIGDSAGGANGPAPGRQQSHAMGETTDGCGGGKSRATSRDVCHCQQCRAVPQGRDGGTEWGWVVGGTEAEQATIARSHKRVIEEWRGLNGKLSR